MIFCDLKASIVRLLVILLPWGGICKTTKSWNSSYIIFIVIILKLQNQQSIHLYKYWCELLPIIVHNKTKIKKRINLQAKIKKLTKITYIFFPQFFCSVAKHIKSGPQMLDEIFIFNWCCFDSRIKPWTLCGTWFQNMSWGHIMTEEENES